MYSRSLSDVLEHLWAWALRYSFGGGRQLSGASLSVVAFSRSCARHFGYWYFHLGGWLYFMRYEPGPVEAIMQNIEDFGKAAGDSE